VDEHPGKGTVINVERSRGAGVAPTCPASAIVTFHDVILECGCVPDGTGLVHSFIATDDGGLNDNPFTIVSDGTGPECSQCFLQDNDCSTITFHEDFWNTNPDCSGDPQTSMQVNPCNTVLIAVDGVWWLIAIWRNALWFYGHTTDLSLPITNENVCTAEFSDHDPPCWLTGSPLNGISAGGTATITIP
jgi:hypothetical protein